MSDQTYNRPYRWVILVLAVLTFLMTFITRFAWPPLIPVIVPILNISMTEAGSYMTAFYIGYIITQIPAGLLGDRFGVRHIMAATLMLQAAATFFLGSIDNFETGFALRVLSGLAGGCVYAACFRALVQWFSPTQRGLAFGALMSASPLGLFLANAAAPLLEEALSWRGVFRAVGVGAAIIGGIVLTLMKEHPAPADASPSADPKPGFFDGLKYVFSNRNIIFLAIGGFTLIWAQIGFYSWGNTYLKQELAFDLKTAGGIMSSLGLMGMAAAPLSGFVAGKTGRGKLLLVLANLMVIIGVLVFGRQTSAFRLLAMTSLIGIGLGTLNAVYSFAISTFSESSMSATVGGATNFILQLAGVFVPMVTGQAIDFGCSFGTVWWIIVAGPILALGCLALVGQPPPVKTD